MKLRPKQAAPARPTGNHAGLHPAAPFPLDIPPLDPALEHVSSQDALQGPAPRDADLQPLPPSDDHSHHDNSADLNRRLVELSERLVELEVCLNVAESERTQVRAVLEALPHPVIITDPFEDVVLMSASAAELIGLRENGPPGPAGSADAPSPAGRGHGPLAHLIPDPHFHQLVYSVRSLHRRGMERIVRRTVDLGFRRATFDITLVCACNLSDGKPSPWGVVTILSEVAPETPSPAGHPGAWAEASSLIADQLRQPLLALHGFTNLLADTARASSDIADHLALVRDEVDRLNRLVADFGLLARLESDLVTPAARPVDLLDLARTAIDTLRKNPHTQTLQADLHAPHASPPVVHADRDLLLGVLQNLIRSLAALMPPGQSLRLDIGPSAQLGFTDLLLTAPTLRPTPAHLPATPDREADLSRSTTDPTLELPLRLARSVVERVHGGVLTVRQTPERQLQLHLSLPLVRTPAASTAGAGQKGQG